MEKKKVIAIICVICMSAAIFAGCAKQPNGEDIVSDPPNPSTFPASGSDVKIPESFEPDESYNMPEPEFGDEKDFEIEVEGQKETVTMTRTELKDSIGAYGSRYFLYVDLERYSFSTFESEYSLMPVATGESPNCAIKFLPYAGKTAEEVKAEAVERIEKFGGTIYNEKEVKLGDNKALYFETEEGYAYCVEDEGGSLYIGVAFFDGVVREGHGARFDAMLKTLEIQ